MKKLFVTSCLILLIVASGYSQDIIWLKNGQKLNCKVLSQDSSSVYFYIMIKGLVKKTFVDNSTIDSIKFNNHVGISSERIEKSTIGFGMGLDHGGFGVSDRVTGISVSIMLGGSPEGASDHFKLYIDKLRIEQVLPELSRGFDLRKNSIAYCHSGYISGARKQALVQNVKDP